MSVRHIVFYIAILCFCPHIGFAATIHVPAEPAEITPSNPFEISESPVNIASVYNISSKNSILADFHLKFRTYSRPVDMYLAYESHDQSLLFLDSDQSWTTDFSAFSIESTDCGAVSSAATEILNNAVQVYWLITPANGGKSHEIDWENGAYELGWYLINISIPEWTLFEGELKQISVGADGSVWGVQDDGRILKKEIDGWAFVEGELDRISVGSAEHIWGVDETGAIFKRDEDHWAQIEGELKQISVGSADQIWGVNETGSIFKWDKR